MTPLASRAEPSPAQADPALPLGLIWVYCLPMLGFQLVAMVFMLYFMKYGTDVLLIAPAAMGLIVSVARIWDGVSDPLAGYLSDRTRSARGRRLSWMRAAALPLGASLVLVWSPPGSLSGAALACWVLVALLVYETASTAFFVPYGALGMELTDDYHERTRLFGYRHVLMAAGTPLGLGVFELVRRAEDQRQVAFSLMLVAGAIIAALILYASARLPERPEHQGRGAVNLLTAVADVFRNPHSRILLAVYGIETFGSSTITMLSVYVMQYIVKLPDLTIWFMLVAFVPMYAFTPAWLRLARRFGKKRVWVFAMALSSLAYYGMFFVSHGQPLYLCALAFLLGTAGGCGSILAPAVQADVIDYDELQTGQRKEGAYLAVWNFVRKSAGAVTAALTGVVLQVMGFEPNAEQSAGTRTAILVLFSVLPGTAYLIGTLLFSRFRLNEREHAALREALAARRPLAGPTPG